MSGFGAEGGLDVRNASAAKGGAWRVYRRLLGYAVQYRFRLAVCLLLALVVAASTSSMIFSAVKVVELAYGNEVEASKDVEAFIDKLNENSSLIEAVTPMTASEAAVKIRGSFAAMREDPTRAMVVIAIVLISLSIVGGVARFFQEYLAGAIGASISVQLGKEMFENVMDASLSFFEQHPSGEILARFANDIFMVNRGLASVLIKLLREPIKVIVFLVMALLIDVKLTVTVLVVLPAIAFVIVLIGRKVKKNVSRSLKRIASMVSVASETFRGIRIVKSFCMEEHETARVHGELDKLRKHLFKVVKANATVGPLTEFLMILALVLFLLLSGRAIEDGLKPGELVKLALCLAVMFDPMRKLVSVNNMIQTSVASGERVFEFIDVKPDVVEAPQAKAMAPLETALRFDNVHFAYNRGEEVLKGVSFDIQKGEMVALVGPSGAGKSTIVNLIPRFYDVTRGKVTMDGTDIRDVTFKSLRDQISVVTQQTILFDESVRDNIAFGRQTYSDERVREAARAAHADGFVEKLPQGYDTRLGESGDTLSGGQRQRLAIARAIIKDPAILIMDEATSSLDSESEQAIQKAIEEFVVGRTTIVIAHRLSTIQRADRILVIDDGRVVEQGSHAQLLAQGGIYRRLHEIQFSVDEQA